MPDPTPPVARKTLIASMRAIGQSTKVTAAETVTDTRWEKDTLGSDKFVPTAQASRVANFDTRTRTAWETGTVAIDQPQLRFEQTADIPVAYGEALRGLDIRLDGATVVAADTRVVRAETLTDTHWEVGDDGDTSKARAVRQDTRVDNFDTVTRARWKVDAPWTGGPVPIAAPPVPVPAPPPLPVPAPVPVPAPYFPPSGAHRNYTVRPGDYLAKIARTQLGSAARWNEIVELNRDRYPSLATHPERLQPGWVLRLPQSSVAPVIVNPVIWTPVPAPAPTPAAPVTPPPPPPAPVPPPQPAPSEDAKIARLRRDLDIYLNADENKSSEAMLHVLRTAPQYAEAATPEQKGRMINRLIDGSTNSDERKGVLKLFQMADARGEVVAVAEYLRHRRDALPDLVSDLGDNGQGFECAKIWLKNGLYAQEWFYRAMDDDAAVGLCKALGFREPMIGTNDELRALPEGARHHMIKQLLSGNLTWSELAMAEWINAHNEIKYRIPDYRNR